MFLIRRIKTRLRIELNPQPQLIIQLIFNLSHSPQLSPLTECFFIAEIESNVSDWQNKSAAWNRTEF